jgi:hypothetical protein
LVLHIVERAGMASTAADSRTDSGGTGEGDWSDWSGVVLIPERAQEVQ